MGCRLRANLPQVVEQLKPEWNYLKEFRRQEFQFKSKQKNDCDRCHRTHSLPPIPDDSEVWITSDRKQVISGRVMGQREMPRSYIVSIPGASVIVTGIILTLFRHHPRSVHHNHHRNRSALHNLLFGRHRTGS